MPEGRRDRDALARRAAGLSVEQRALLGEAWAIAGLDEHASVGSFARFSLHLLAVGAPPVLLDEAHRAARDEIRHARACFELATILGGTPVGPGAVPLRGDVLGPLDLAHVVAAAVIEGCVGETIAAHEAEVARAGARPAAIRRVLAMIARDEARHAALAWRFVAWALAADRDGAVGAAARRAFDHAEAAIRSDPGLPAPADGAAPALLAAYGRPGPTAATRAAVLAQVVQPARRALGL